MSIMCSLLISVIKFNHEGPNIIAGPRSTPAAPANHVQWYYPAGSAAASPFHHQHHQAVPFYG